MALGIGHDDDYALVVVVSFAGVPSCQAGNEFDGLIDVLDGHVTMDADLPCRRLATGWNTSRGWGSPRSRSSPEERFDSGRRHPSRVGSCWWAGRGTRTKGTHECPGHDDCGPARE